MRSLFATPLFAVLFAVSTPADAQQGDLRDFIRNLYGGNGIRLRPVAGHDPHFTAESLDQLSRLNNSISSGLNFSSLASGLTSTTFDLTQGLPVTTDQSFGPLVSERAETLGQGRLNFGFSYSRVEYKRFNGTSIDRQTLDLAHIDVNGDNVLGPPPPPLEFERDIVRVNLNLSIKQDIAAFFGSYGITSRWDVGVLVPIVHVKAKAKADATVVDVSPSIDVHFFGPDAEDRPHSESGGDKTGLGDVLLRTKYNFWRGGEWFADAAVLGQVKLPTGDDRDLLGTGTTNVYLGGVLSKQLGPIAPHVNLGYEAAFGRGFDSDNLRFAVGADYRVLPSLTAAVDVLGRVYTERRRVFSDLYDVAIGAKWRPLETGILRANFLVPLNRNEGLRPDFAWTVGIDFTF
jgi:hypothetical protein